MRHSRELFEFSADKARLESDVLAFHIAEFLKLLPEDGPPLHALARVEQADDRNLGGTLRTCVACGDQSGAEAKNAEECLPSLHSIPPMGR